VLRTRPDVTYAVDRLATRATAPTIKDYDALRQVAAYLYTTAHLELVYNSANKSECRTIARLFAFSDAAYLTHSDSKSHSGLHFTLGQQTGVFHARSQKQKIVTLSSTGAEVYAAIESAKDVIFFRNILAEIDFPNYLQQFGSSTTRAPPPLLKHSPEITRKSTTTWRTCASSLSR